jgi:hypothetical protein
MNADIDISEDTLDPDDICVREHGVSDQEITLGPSTSIVMTWEQMQMLYHAMTPWIEESEDSSNAPREVRETR